MQLLAGLGPLGLPELAILLVIVVLIFGVGRLPEVGGAVGKSIREFRKATKDGEEHDASSSAPMMSSAPPAATNGATRVESAPSTEAPAPETARAVFCSECGTKNVATAKFCANCGHALVTPVA